MASTFCDLLHVDDKFLISGNSGSGFHGHPVHGSCDRAQGRGSFAGADLGSHTAPV